MEKLKEELRQSVQAIRSRYEYSCAPNAHPDMIKVANIIKYLL